MMTFRPDLDAYLARIGYRGTPRADLATLDAIVLAHVTTIPFENLDVLGGRGIVLEPRVVEEKLVHARRGGYCFEHNSHLLHVLRALGFAARPLSARVRIGRARDVMPPRTHLLVEVTIDGTAHLADVGVGGLSPTSSLRRDVEGEQVTPHEPRRLVREGAWSGELRAPDARILHQAWFADTWHDVCELTLEEMHDVDRELGNWFTSAHPRSHFRDRLMAARATATGRVTLLDNALTRRETRGEAETVYLRDLDAVRAALEDDFGIALPTDLVFACPWIDWSAPAP